MFYVDTNTDVLDKLHKIKEHQKTLVSNVHSKQKRYNR